MVRVGVVGVGGWGKNHLRVLDELNALTTFCEIDEGKLRFYEQKYGVKGYRALDKMLEDEMLDAVTVCTPTSSHYEVACKIISRGLHAFVEKPLTYSSHEGEKLVELAERKRSILMVGHIERFNPAVRELKDILKSGRIGEPLLLEFHRENKWLGVVKDVGVVADTAVHDIDTARWIFEEEPHIVFARTGRVISEHEDFAAIMLGFKGQRTAFITSNWMTPKKVRQLITVCTGGISTLDFVSQEIRIDDSSGTLIPRRQWQEPLKLELQNFIDSIDKGSQPLVTGRDGVNTTKIAEAALISSETGSPIYLEL